MLRKYVDVEAFEVEDVEISGVRLVELRLFSAGRVVFRVRLEPDEVEDFADGGEVRVGDSTIHLDGVGVRVHDHRHVEEFALSFRSFAALRCELASSATRDDEVDDEDDEVDDEDDEVDEVDGDATLG